MTSEEKVKLVWPLACISRRAHGTMQGVWSDPSPMADFLGKSWEEVATYDRVIAAAHVTDTFIGAPCSLPPWTSSPEVNKALSEESERIADGEVNWHHAPNLRRAELAEKLLKDEVEVRTYWESKYAKEVMLHAVTKFELKEAKATIEQLKSYQTNYEHATKIERDDLTRQVNERGVANETLQGLLRTEGQVRNHWETRCMMMARDYPYSKWQRVSDGVPLSKKSVLVWCPERKNTYCAVYCGNHWEYFGGCGHEITEEVTHWMPKPEMPSCQPLPDKICECTGEGHEQGVDGEFVLTEDYESMLASHKQQVERLSAPVSDEEVHNFASYGENGYVFTDDNVDTLIAARLKEEGK